MSRHRFEFGYFLSQIGVQCTISGKDWGEGAYSETSIQRIQGLMQIWLNYQKGERAAVQPPYKLIRISASGLKHQQIVKENFGLLTAMIHLKVCFDLTLKV